MNAQVHQIAEQVSQNGFNWVEDGRQVIEICRLLIQELPRPLTAPSAKAALRQYLLSSLIVLDRTHSWAMRGKTQAQEEQLYGMFVDLYLQGVAEAPEKAKPKEPAPAKGDSNRRR